MCGIAGQYSYRSTVDAAQVREMIACLKHRGPDAQSVWSDRRVSLGHARLSIVDLDSGSQPMISSNDRYVIVFNGEIYGYKDLRDQLSDCYQFKSKSDTEVILAAYDRFGEGCLEHLNGMFAFVIYDKKSESLFAARDRFGEKPFYYLDNGSEFLFASEIKALHKTNKVSPKIDETALMGYFQNLFVPFSSSIFSDVNVLPPGCFLTVQKSKVRVKPYWKIESRAFNGTYEDAKNQLRVLLRNSVRKQLVADVEVGAFLSGGIDSTTIVGLASEQATKLSTFSFGFLGELDELPYAKLVAERYKTNHNEYIESDMDLVTILNSLSKVFDEPFADSSSLPMSIICRHASNKLRVVLTGDGADELFGGYDWWYQESVEKMVKKKSIQSRKFIENRHKLFSVEELSRLFPQFKFKSKLDFKKRRLQNTPNDLLNEDLTHYMPSDILVKTDRTSMSWGLELRAPFLDRDVAEFAISLPWEWKLGPNNGKRILKEAMRDVIPEPILTRRKQGFGAPVGSWIQTKAVDDLFLDLFSSPRFPSPIDIKEAMKYRADSTYKKWSLIAFQLWAKEWLN